MRINRTTAWILAAAAAIAVSGLGASDAEAKERGCEYRLAGVRDARAELVVAKRRHRGIPLAQARLDRALSKAADEGCLRAVRGTRGHALRYAQDRHGPSHVDARAARIRTRLWRLSAAERRRCLSPAEERERVRLRLTLAAITR